MADQPPEPDGCDYECCCCPPPTGYTMSVSMIDPATGDGHAMAVDIDAATALPTYGLSANGVPQQAEPRRTL